MVPLCVSPEFTDLDRGCGIVKGGEKRDTKRPRDRGEFGYSEYRARLKLTGGGPEKIFTSKTFKGRYEPISVKCKTFLNIEIELF